MSVRARGVIRLVVIVVLLAVTGLGMVNSLGDNTEVVKQAEVEACGKAGCSVQKVSEARSPFGQTLGFQLGTEHPQVVEVECKRALILLGDWQCKRGAVR